MAARAGGGEDAVGQYENRGDLGIEDYNGVQYIRNPFGHTDRRRGADCAARDSRGGDDRGACRVVICCFPQAIIPVSFVGGGEGILRWQMAVRP